MTLISANSLKKVHARSRPIVFSQFFGRTSKIIYNNNKYNNTEILAIQFLELKKSMHIY